MQIKVEELDEGDEGIAEDRPEKKKPRKEEEEVEPIISSYYNFDDSDITIVSSDKIHFKVHASTLRRVSLTFRETFERSAPTDGREPIILSDPCLETSSVLEKFFDLIYPVAHHDLSQALVYHHVIRLARKWHCLYALEALYNAAKLSVTNRGFTKPPDYLFIIAVGLEDTSLLQLVISECSEQKWHHTWIDLDYEAEGIPSQYITSDDYQDDIMYPRAFEFGAWTLDHYLAIPSPIIWCVLCTRKGRRGKDWNVIAGELTRLISRLFDTRKIGVGPRTLSELAAVRQQYKPYPRAEQSFSFQETWGDTTHFGPQISRNPIEETPLHSSPTVSTDHHYDDDDIVMVSSDNVSFRVDSIILRRASPVLSNILSLSPASTTPSPLVFTDLRLESSSVISALLDLLYDHEMPSFYNPTLIQDLIDFADKWEIGVIHKFVRKELIASMGLDDESSCDRFLIAIKLNDLHLAARIIEISDDHYVLGVLIGTNKGSWSDIDIDTFDFNPCEYEEFVNVPPKVAWALQRAAMMWDHGFGTSTKMKDDTSRHRQMIGENFHRIMDPSFEPDGLPPSGSRDIRLDSDYASHGYGLFD